MESTEVDCNYYVMRRLQKHGVTLSNVCLMTNESIHVTVWVSRLSGWNLLSFCWHHDKVFALRKKWFHRGIAFGGFKLLSFHPNKVYSFAYCSQVTSTLFTREREGWFLWQILDQIVLSMQIRIVWRLLANHNNSWLISQFS